MMLEMMLALTLHDIAWLAGDWQTTAGARCIEERWTSPSSNMLVGMSRTVEGARTVSFEFLRIEARADGIYCVPQPIGRPPVEFKLASESGSELVFLNPGHGDHLKRIVYRRQGDDGVAARIEGEDGGRAFAADFPYRRIPEQRGEPLRRGEIGRETQFRALTPEALLAKCATPEGTRLTTWKWLLMMPEHEIHHRGEIYTMLGMLNVPTPPIDGMTATEVQARFVRHP